MLIFNETMELYQIYEFSTSHCKKTLCSIKSKQMQPMQTFVRIKLLGNSFVCVMIPNFLCPLLFIENYVHFNPPCLYQYIVYVPYTYHISTICLAVGNNNDKIGKIDNDV